MHLFLRSSIDRHSHTGFFYVPFFRVTHIVGGRQDILEGGCSPSLPPLPCPSQGERGVPNDRILTTQAMCLAFHPCSPHLHAKKNDI
ncbi:hypothetical protein CEXT_525381 [Caerostris extrusa]|uniref:Uncharacterized protein n=1 Tax=Caerostris extrusa TaxID=172846 RepID=A0AAV4MPE5_CAEEX|nr:hypothetical protein CEXT_525381 [Caerostris extrusa]